MKREATNSVASLYHWCVVRFLMTLFLQDVIHLGVDVRLGDVTAAVEIDVLQDELVAGLTVHGIHHLHDVGGIHLAVAIGIANPVKRTRHRLAVAEVQHETAGSSYAVIQLEAGTLCADVVTSFRIEKIVVVSETENAVVIGGEGQGSINADKVHIVGFDACLCVGINGHTSEHRILDVRKAGSAGGHLECHRTID